MREVCIECLSDINFSLLVYISSPRSIESIFFEHQALTGQAAATDSSVKMLQVYGDRDNDCLHVFGLKGMERARKQFSQVSGPRPVLDVYACLCIPVAVSIEVANSL